MPELPPFNPSVSVFHFTSKVSSAKIAKYKLATERGMVTNHVPVKENAKSLKRSASTSSFDHKKRPRLRLSVRDPEPPDGDTITVSQPRQTSTAPPAKTRLSRTTINTNGAGPHSPDSSELSSCDSDIIAADQGRSRRPRSKTTKDGYGDFMSYYVLDDDNDRPGKGANSTAKAQQRPVGKNPPNKPPSQIVARSRQDADPRQRHPPPQQQQSQWHAPAASVAMAPALTTIRARDPDPVPLMIKKLESLSAALTDFGGVPHIPQSPIDDEDEESPVDNFLAMFGEAPTHQKQSNLPLSLEELVHPGTSDQPLIHGIQFIMNALRSWAEQRLAQQIAQQMQRPSSAGTKQSPLDLDKQHMNLPDPADTPEGRAISAFRAMVESGCLRVNSVLPLKLAKAIRLLYMQIDHLINQNNKSQPPWRCLSYVAQIEANRIRVQKWREAQAKAQEEMIRQQQLSHQQMMRQMGLPDHLTSTMFYHQSGDHETSEQERRNSSTDLVRLPTNPRPNIAGNSRFAAMPSYHPHTDPNGHVPQHASNVALSRSNSIGSPHPEQSRAVSSAGHLHRSSQSNMFSAEARTFSRVVPYDLSNTKMDNEMLGVVEAAPEASKSTLDIPHDGSVMPSKGWAPINTHYMKHE